MKKGRRNGRRVLCGSAFLFGCKGLFLDKEHVALMIDFDDAFLK